MKNNWLDKYKRRKRKAGSSEFDALVEQLDYIKKKYKIKKLDFCDSERWIYYEKRYGYHEDSVTGRIFRVDWHTGEIEEQPKDD